MDQPPYRDVTVGDLLTRLARAIPDRDALVYAQGPRWTFEALEHEARTIARGLMALGVQPGGCHPSGGFCIKVAARIAMTR